MRMCRIASITARKWTQETSVICIQNSAHGKNGHRRAAFNGVHSYNIIELLSWVFRWKYSVQNVSLRMFGHLSLLAEHHRRKTARILRRIFVSSHELFTLLHGIRVMPTKIFVSVRRNGFFKATAKTSAIRHATGHRRSCAAKRKLWNYCLIGSI